MLEFLSLLRHLHDIFMICIIRFAKKIQVGNSQYKIHVDTRQRHVEFQVGDYVMIRIQPERFPSGTIKKLQAHSARPFKVLKRIDTNAYVIDFPHDYGISSSYIIEDLFAYKGPTVISDTPFDEPLLDSIDAPIPTPLPLNLPYAHKESIDVILDEQIISTRDGGVQHFLIRWWRRPNFDCTWITQDELHHLDTNLL